MTPAELLAHVLDRVRSGRYSESGEFRLVMDCPLPECRADARKLGYTYRRTGWYGYHMHRDRLCSTPLRPRVVQEPLPQTHEAGVAVAEEEPREVERPHEARAGQASASRDRGSGRGVRLLWRDDLRVSDRGPHRRRRSTNPPGNVCPRFVACHPGRGLPTRQVPRALLQL